MRISELSATSAVATATIKFYQREGLLPPGEATGPNQASYGVEHVRRLRLIRALIDVGGLSVASAREVLGAVDSPDLPLAQVFGSAQRAISQADLYADPASDEATERVRSLVAARGWHVSAGNPGLVGAANVVDAFGAIGHPELADFLEGYAEAAEVVARADLRSVGRQADVASMAETVVAGTVLGDAMFAALRRIAQEHITFELYPVDASEAPGHTPLAPGAADAGRDDRRGVTPCPK